MGMYMRDFLDYNDRPKTKEIIEEAKYKGKEQAKEAYPYAIVHTEAEARKLAEPIFISWETKLIDEYDHPGKEGRRRNWNAVRDEVWRLYSSGFVGGYNEVVAEEDRKAGKQTATSTAQGVSITLLNVDRNGKEYIYTVRIDDPALQYPIIRELAFDASNLQPWQGAYGMAFSDVYPKNR